MSNYLTTDIHETNKEKFSIFPNPTNEIINIENAVLESNVLIRDINGKVQKILQVTSNKMEINIENLSSGIYFIQNLDQSIRFIKL